MLLTVLVLVVSAAPLKVAATNLNVVEASESRAQFYTEHFADRLADQGLDITSPREVSTLLGLERERQLLGCQESTCLAEIIGALGVDGVAVGDVAHIGGKFQVNLKILSPQTGKRLAGFSAQTADEEGLIAALTRAAEEMSRQLAEALGRPLPALTRRPAMVSQKQSSLRSWWWAPAALAVVGLVGGSIGLSVAESARGQLATAGSLKLSEAQSLLDSGTSARTLGYVGLGVGSAALLTTLAFVLFGGESPVAPSVMMLPGGAGLSWSGVLP